MRKRFLFAMPILLASVATAQESIPAGTILPLQLNSTINSSKARAHQAVSARLMQNVPLPGGSKIPAGAEVLGTVGSVHTDGQGHTSVTLRFDTLSIGKRRIPISTNLRAMATMMTVEAAQIPATGPDRGTSDFYWVTQQIGGETVYRGGGPVTRGSTVVGKSVVDGVLVHPSAAGKCEGEDDADDRPQAFWVFASTVCGLYDFPDLRLVHAGRNKPRGEITIASTKGPLKIPAGSGLLLRVQGS
jgi:hypothetical protein